MTVNALEAAQASGSVKQVVLTSSSAAAFVSQANVEGIVIDESRSMSPMILERNPQQTV